MSATRIGDPINGSTVAARRDVAPLRDLRSSVVRFYFVLAERLPDRRLAPAEPLALDRFAFGDRPRVEGRNDLSADRSSSISTTAERGSGRP